MIRNFKRQLSLIDGRAILRNFISLTSLQIASLVLSFFTLPYVLKTIGFENYGIIGISTSLTLYFSSLTDFSFMITATRDVSIHRHNRTAINYIFSKVILVKSVFFLVSMLTIALIVFLYEPFYQHRLIFFISAFSLGGNLLFPDWFFQGIEKTGAIAIIKVSVQLISTALIFVFINAPTDYWIYSLLNTSGVLVSGIIALTILFVKYKVRFVPIPISKIKTTVKENIPIFVNQFVPTLYNNTSTFLLGFWVTPSAIGVYVAIKKVIDIAIIAQNTLSRVFFPFLNKNKNSFPIYKKLIFSLSLLGIAILIVSYQLVFTYLGIESNVFNFSILCILSFGIIGISFYDVYGLNYLIINRQDKAVMKNTIQASLIGMCASFPLIMFYGTLGSAINLLISRMILGLGIYRKYLYHQVKNEDN